MTKKYVNGIANFLLRSTPFCDYGRFPLGAEPLSNAWIIWKEEPHLKKFTFRKP